MTKILTAFAAGAILAGGFVYSVLREQSVKPVVEVHTPVDSSPAVTVPAPVVERQEPSAPPESVVRPRPRPVPRPFRFTPTVIEAAPTAPMATPPRIMTPVSQDVPPILMTPVSDMPPPPEPNRVTLPAGTVFNVILAEGLSSRVNFPGDEFLVTLDRPVVIDGFIIADRDSRMEGLVVESVDAGKVKGPARLGFKLIRLHTSDRQILDIETDVFTVKGNRQRGRDAAKIGGAASIGAMIGGIAGGGTGAAIGAAVGGAAGTGAVLATRGSPAQLEAETRVPLRLAEPLTITEQIY